MVCVEVVVLFLIKPKERNEISDKSARFLIVGEELIRQQ